MQKYGIAINAANPLASLTLIQGPLISTLAAVKQTINIMKIQTGSQWKPWAPSTNTSDTTSKAAKGKSIHFGSGSGWLSLWFPLAMHGIHSTCSFEWCGLGWWHRLGSTASHWVWQKHDAIFHCGGYVPVPDNEARGFADQEAMTANKCESCPGNDLWG